MASVISNFSEFSALDKMQSLIQINSRWTLQLIHGISNNLQKLFRWFNGTTIFLKKKLFPPAVFSVFPARVPIYLNESELTNVK